MAFDRGTNSGLAAPKANTGTGKSVAASMRRDQINRRLAELSSFASTAGAMGASLPKELDDECLALQRELHRLFPPTKAAAKPNSPR